MCINKYPSQNSTKSPNLHIIKALRCKVSNAPSLEYVGGLKRVEKEYKRILDLTSSYEGKEIKQEREIVYGLLRDLYIKQELFESALGVQRNLIEEVKAANTNDQLIYANLLLKTGDLDGAINDFSYIIDCDPRNYSAYLGIEEAYLKQGKIDAANIYRNLFFELNGLSDLSIRTLDEYLETENSKTIEIGSCEKQQKIVH